MKTSLTTELPGKLIAVEGLDGSGKSTQLYLLKRWLELRGLKVYFTEWNSSVIVKKATSKGKKRQLLTPTTFSLIHSADLADRYERQILPLLKAGYLVLCDRYVYTAFARDAVRGCSRTWLRNLYGFARHPDLTLFFDTPLSVALSRILSGRPQLKYHEAGMDLGLANDPYQSFRLFQERIYNEYLGMRDEFSFVTIDGSVSIEEQQIKVREIVGQSFDLPIYRWKTVK
ncbi:dTMP kinase [Geotalea uraniireducens]|uniref:Thymidylate kinase n=1 Tax=Geotalea uraniireducens (strain Rf4) TaxID=351605 RepID=A5G4M6_GEOUR|nr:thymidylate kinase [Geotalea uraniireducens]ABQ26744.1 thymidylate kinase [Geotalea uraniireducens Rf4]